MIWIGADIAVVCDINLNITLVLCILTKWSLWSYLNVFLDLLVFLLGSEDFFFREGLS